jgi:UDP-N-acetylglucosamine--N-acetylmuramyl-(pentapeptide) pyrophosphoryl-undecaprenol N-acetylglucosamine transferase
MHNKPVRIMISGGGTGGHIFPAIAIANTVKMQAPDSEILFVGAKGKMEMEKVPAAGYTIEGLWISGLQRRLTIKNLSFPFKVISSLMKARKLIRKFKPDVVVGVGGFASGPLLRVAAKSGVPTLIQEQNSFPGITNKILSKTVDKICVAYQGMEKFFPATKIIVTGNPVRSEMVDINGKRDEALSFFNLKKDKPVLLIVGGSLGARTINEGIQEALSAFVDAGIQVVWQTGKGYYEIAKNIAKSFEDNGVTILDFVTRMDLAYAAADLIISRAGAIAISELCIIGKPVILVPSPFVAEDHQTKNAMVLVEKKAAVLVKDVEIKTKLKDTVVSLMNNEQEREVLGKNISGLALKNAADMIVAEIFKLIKK